MFVTAAVLILAGQDPQVTTLPADKKVERKVCRTEHGVGTRFRQRVCHTKAQWRQVDGENHDNGVAVIDHVARSVRDANIPGPQPQ